MKRCTTCKRDLAPHVLYERIGKDLYCVPCADDLWKSGDDQEYRMTCMGCFGRSYLQLFPQRVGRDVVGILILCMKCSHIMRGKQCVIQIMGQESKPQPAGIYPENRYGRYCCDVAGCDHFASWKQISGPDHEQDLRWLCEMHKSLLDAADTVVQKDIPKLRGRDVPVASGPPLDEGRGTIWECDAFHKTARQAADEFAATFWDAPRKALAIDPHGFFRVKGGQRLYQVRLVDNVPTVYRITVMGPE